MWNNITFPSNHIWVILWAIPLWKRNEEHLPVLFWNKVPDKLGATKIQRTNILKTSAMSC